MAHRDAAGGRPHIIPAKERSDASRDPFRNVCGWQRVRTYAPCRNGSRIGLAVRDDGAGRRCWELDAAARAYLTVIVREPEAVARAILAVG
jgi:hypothetical protein